MPFDSIMSVGRSPQVNGAVQSQTLSFTFQQNPYVDNAAYSQTDTLNFTTSSQKRILQIFVNAVPINSLSIIATNPRLSVYIDQKKVLTVGLGSDSISTSGWTINQSADILQELLGTSNHTLQAVSEYDAQSGNRYQVSVQITIFYIDI